MGNKSKAKSKGSTTSSTSSEAAVRRSGRKRVSTTVKIQGYDVKRDNNYTFNAVRYEMGTHEADDPVTKKARTATASETKKKAPRQMTQAEKDRTQHNDKVKAAIETKKSFRMDFLAKHKDVIDPFIDESTRIKVEEWGNQKKKAASYVQEDLFLQPDLVTGGEMRDYQLAGLNFLLNLHRQNIGMILGDEMGLGKTLQTISLLAHLKEKDVMCGPSLVVCPLSVLYSWCNELARWAPSLKVIRLHSSNTEERERQRKEVAENGTKYDVIVTTYEMCKVPQLVSMWSRLYFRLCVLDEGHKIKSRVTQIAQAVRKIHCENRLILTGTPLQNNLVELVALLNFLAPDVFTCFKPFEDAFDITNNHIDKQKMLQAQKVLDLFMLRRLKDQVEKLLPKKIETKVYCPMSKEQVFWYKSLLMQDINCLAKAQQGEVDTNSSTTISKLRHLFMQLRKATLHPFLFPDAEPDIGKTTVTELIAASGKLAVLDLLLRSLFLKGHRVCLFSQFTSALDIVADYCELRGWKYCCFDGRTSRAKRNYFINAFNQPESPYFIFLMSTRSGGLGTNLQSADTVVLFDSDWNPQSDLQAIARCHRLGQKKTVHVYRLISAGTIEERMVQRAEKKLLLDQMVNRSKPVGVNEENEVNMKLSGAEMLQDIKFGSAAVFGDSSLNKLPSNTEIHHIIDRKRLETDSTGSLRGNAFHNAATFNATAALNDTQTFNGVDFAKIRQEHKRKQQAELPKTMRGIAHLWTEIAQLQKKRQVKSRLVMIEGSGSGYGQSHVPILASNNYDLQKGESSVFDRELSSKEKERYAVPKKNQKAKFVDNQEWCKHCGEGGLLYLCFRCPISVHKECCKRAGAQAIFSCDHHWCTACGKSALDAGGLLFACQSCPDSWCEDCLPKGREGFRIIGKCDRFEKVGFDSTKNCVYIHCSSYCEKYAKEVWGWELPKTHSRRQACPDSIDVSYNFGSTEDLLEDYNRAAQETPAIAIPRLSKRRIDYGELSDDRTAGPATSTSLSSSDAESDVEEGADDHRKPAAKPTVEVERQGSTLSGVASNVKKFIFEKNLSGPNR